MYLFADAISIVQEIKPFYMKGNGAFAKCEKIPKPKLKLDCPLAQVGTNMNPMQSCGYGSKLSTLIVGWLMLYWKWMDSW